MKVHLTLLSQTESLVVAVAELSAVTGGHVTPPSVKEWVGGERGQKFAVVTVFEEEVVFVKGEWVYSVAVVICAGWDGGDHSEAAETGTESLNQHK